MPITGKLFLTLPRQFSAGLKRGQAMLFLFNTKILEIEMPEYRLAQAWRTLGCGEPGGMRGVDAVNFVRAVLESHAQEGLEPDAGLQADLASLLIAKTGANAAIFVTGNSGSIEPRLTQLPPRILQALKAEADGDNVSCPIEEVWANAA